MLGTHHVLADSLLQLNAVSFVSRWFEAGYTYLEPRHDVFESLRAVRMFVTSLVFTFVCTHYKIIVLPAPKSILDLLDETVLGYKISMIQGNKQDKCLPGSYGNMLL